MSEFNNTIINASAAFNVKFKGGQEAAEPDYKGICTVNTVNRCDNRLWIPR